MNPRKVALVDLDDTIADTTRHMLRHGIEKHNSTHQYHELTRDYREKKPGDKQWNIIVKEFLGDVDLVEAVAVYPFALEALAQLKKLGYKIHLATARKSNLHAITPRWLKKHKLSSFVDGIHPRPDGVKSTQFKIDVARKIGATIAFDDTYDVSKALAEFGIRVYLIEKPWNKGELLHENMIPVRDFAAAVEQLETEVKPANKVS